MKMNIRILSRKICFGLLLMIMPIMFESCLTTALVYTISQDLKSQNQDQKETTTLTNNSKKTTKEKSMGSDKNNESNIIRLQCLGEGHTRHEAINNALRSGLEQVYGTFISSDTRILNDEIVKDEIVSLSSGNVTDYKILTESNVGKTWIVTIEGGFSQQKLAKFVESKGGAVTVSTTVYAQNILIEKARVEAQRKIYEQIVEKAKLITPLCFDYSVEVSANSPRTLNPYYFNKESGRRDACNGGYCITVYVTATTNDNFSEVLKLMVDVPFSLPKDFFKRGETLGINQFVGYYGKPQEHYRLFRDGIDVTKHDKYCRKRVEINQCYYPWHPKRSLEGPIPNNPTIQLYTIKYNYYLTFEELQDFQSEFRVEYIN